MDDSYVGASQGRYSHGNGDRRNFVHDTVGTREHIAFAHVHGNDRNSSGITHSRSAHWEYRVKAAALSGGVFLSGIVYTVISIVGK